MVLLMLKSNSTVSFVSHSANKGNVNLSTGLFILDLLEKLLNYSSLALVNCPLLYHQQKQRRRYRWGRFQRDLSGLNALRESRNWSELTRLDVWHITRDAHSSNIAQIHEKNTLCSELHAGTRRAITLRPQSTISFITKLKKNKLKKNNKNYFSILQENTKIGPQLLCLKTYRYAFCPSVTSVSPPT